MKIIPGQYSWSIRSVLSQVAIYYFTTVVVHGLTVPGSLDLSRRDSPQPIEVSASQFFEGVDGPWSTFELRVGTPSQNIRVLPGSSATATIVILSGACERQSSSCAKGRGGVFNQNASATWNDIGLFYLGFEDALGYTEAADFGFDTGRQQNKLESTDNLTKEVDIVGLGYQGSGGPLVNHSVVAGTEDIQFYLGVLGLKPEPTNFTTLNDPQPGFMQLLKKEKLIPSLSYSYTAGAPYRTTKALGSLILGGYDEGLFTDSKSSYGFSSDQARDLTVGIKAISTNSSTKVSNLLPSGLISSFIDSSVAEIYLPMDACQAFERAFGLEFNETTDRYLVSDKLHKQLTTDNPSISFTITTAISGGDSFNITLPYASFDLMLSAPLAQSQSRYFPLRRAANATQYTLGRTFLQEAYLIVDYERGSFGVHPRSWAPTQTSKVVAIETPGSRKPPQNSQPTPSATDKPSAKKKLSGGAIAGVAVSTTVVVIVVFVVISWRSGLIPRKRKEEKGSSTKTQATEDPPTTEKPELASPEIPTVLAEDRKSPLTVSELHSPVTPSELSGVIAHRELDGAQIYEMMGSEIPEMSAVRHEYDESPIEQHN